MKEEEIKMANNDNKYLTLARRAREEDNTEDAKKYYDMVRTDDPDNVEARFFYAYYHLWDGTQGESFRLFSTFCKGFEATVKATIAADMADDEKKQLLMAIYTSIQGLAVSMSHIQQDLWQAASKAQNSSDTAKYNDQKKKCEAQGTALLYTFGDLLNASYANDKDMNELAVSAWKKGVSLQQQYPYCGLDKGKPDAYAAKIQKYDPSYTLPKKAGCISFG